MREDNIGKAMRQVNEILQHIPLEQKNKISKKFLNLLSENEDKNYTFEFDPNKELEDGYLLKETEILLQVIYRNYWCEDEEEKRKIDELLVENENKYVKEINEKYNYENLFKNNKKETLKIEENPNVPIVYENKNIFTKIVNFIKNIFKRERNL